MKRLFTALLCLVSLSAGAQNADFFTPVHKNTLRLPAVPLITADPYFCLWSKYDHLYDGSVTHWSGVKKPLNGAVYVDGKAYRFMGESLESIYPIAAEKAWKGKYVTSEPSGSWTAIDYDDSSWQSGEAPWGGGDDGYDKTVKTKWEGGNVDIWVRRSFDLDEINADALYYIMYKHDDVFQLYVNGTQVVSTGETWDVNGKTVLIDKSLLREGSNVISCHCHNTTGGAYVDMGIYLSLLEEARQKSCTVTATSTYYTFTCGGIDLDVVFTTPQVMDDLVLFSTPISYISYQAKPNDGKDHSVSVFLQTSAEMAVRNSSQETRTKRKVSNGNMYFYGGTSDQKVLSQTGDLIDWGYVYVFSDQKEGHNLKLGKHDTVLREFASTGIITSSVITKTSPGGTYYSIVYNDSLGIVDEQGKRAFAMFGYDDTYSIQYFNNNRKGYWANNGRTIMKRFEDLYENYEDIMQRCRGVDRTIYDDGYAVGGTKYAEILASVYRQTNAAHKLFTDAKGNLMFMSRENNSGGFINTLDVTYPSQPLYWLYSPALAKAMITPVFEYSALGKWNYDFPNHDLGHYPQANGNHYGNPADGSGSTMPVEQSGNMLTLAAIIAIQDGDLDYLRKYLPYMTKWANYLVENGKDPANQLCTDDFMGHSARNTNLAAKAIMGVMSYSEILRMLDDNEGAEEYKDKALDMAAFWKKNAVTGAGSNKHYLLNFGANSSTWSSKYNLIWDKIWGWDIMKDVRTTEASFYMNKMQAYGLPLDSRGDLCKSDWQMWVMGFADLTSQRTKLINTLWKYINKTPSRVPVSDNHNVKGGSMAMFQARSVVGGYWMRVFVEKFIDGGRTGIEIPQTVNNKSSNGKWYDLSGRQIVNSKSSNGKLNKGIYIKDGKKQIIK